MQHRRGAALFPFADAIIETQQMGEALWVLEGRALARRALGKGERKAEIRTPYSPFMEGDRPGPSSHQRVLAPEDVTTGGENS